MEKWKDYSLLRPFDLEAAKNGALVCWMDEGGPLRYVGKATCGADTACFEWIGGTHKGTFETYSNTNLRMSPLCWVEGRPVYPGDVMYWKCVVAEFKAGDRILLGGQMVDGALVTTYGTSNGFTRRIDGIETLQENLTWEKSKRTVKKAGWINIYPLSWMDGRAGAIFQTKTEADSSARSGRIACTSVEWEEAIP